MLHHQPKHTGSEPSSCISLVASVAFSLPVVSLSSSLGNLWETLPPSPTWYVPSLRLLRLTKPADTFTKALAIVLLAVFFIQALFNMFQDWSTSRTMSSIKEMLPEEGDVIRDGQLIHLSAADVVPGDVVRVKAGNKLPADMRIVQASSDLKFDRSVLTGESKPVAGTVDHTDTNYLETHNIGLQGTHCILGSCVGIVVATGDKTVFGRIASLTNEPKVKMTTLEKEVFYFVIIIASIMIVMITLVCVIW